MARSDSKLSWARITALSALSALSPWILAISGLATSNAARADSVLPLELMASGLTSPVGAAHAGDGSGRLFIADQPGQIRVINSNGILLPAAFLDVSSQLVTLGFAGPNTFDERGLLSVAFHPDFSTNGRFYTYTSQPLDGPADFTVPMPAGVDHNHQAVITEWTAGNPASNVFSGTSRQLMRIDEPQFNHDGGAVAFGPDGNLYISLGDGGSANDVADGHTAGLGNGQDRTNVLGTILRIDVDGSDSDNGAYGIPGSNPFTSDASVPDEIFAYGFRNPWQFSFDDGPGGTHRLFVGDVGQNLFEEVSIVASGGNYGWNRREGSHPFDPDNPNTVPATGPTTGPSGEPLIDPVIEYFNAKHPDVQAGDPNGRSVVAGHVYRGSNHGLSDLVGTFVFGDWSTQFGSPDGSVFTSRETAPGVFDLTEHMVDLGIGPQRLGRYLLSFGEDERGAIYFLTNQTGTPFGASGQVFRLVPEPAALTCLAAMGMLGLRRRR